MRTRGRSSTNARPATADTSAAINGSRGPVDTPELVRRRVALDIEYIERQNFWFDLYIMAMTIPCLLGDRDAVR